MVVGFVIYTSMFYFPRHTSFVYPFFRNGYLLILCSVKISIFVSIMFIWCSFYLTAMVDELSRLIVGFGRLYTIVELV